MINDTSNWNDDERSKLINELTFDIFSELPFSRHDKEFKTFVGDE